MAGVARRGLSQLPCAGLDGPLATCQGLFNESDECRLRRPNLKDGDGLIEKGKDAAVRLARGAVPQTANPPARSARSLTGAREHGRMWPGHCVPRLSRPWRPGGTMLRACSNAVRLSYQKPTLGSIDDADFKTPERRLRTHRQSMRGKVRRPRAWVIRWFPCLLCWSKSPCQDCRDSERHEPTLRYSWWRPHPDRPPKNRHSRLIQR